MDASRLEKGLLIVDEKFCIISTNEAFRKWYPHAENGQLCYKAFYNFDKPCPHCRIVSGDYNDKVLLNPTFGTWINSSMEKIQMKDIGDCFSISTKPVNNDPLEDNNENENIIYSNQHLLEANELWNTALNNMPNGYHRCAADKDFTFLNVSQRFCEILGYSKEELETLFDNKYVNLVHPDDLSIIHAFMDDINNNENNSYAQCIYRIKSKKGYIWALDTTKYVKSGDSSFYQGSITDVSNIVDVHQKDRENLLITESKINQYKKALISGANVIYEVNVTKNILEVANFYREDQEVGISSVCDLEVPCPYTDYLPIIVERISPEDKEICYETNTIEYFKRCFEQGVLKWQLEYDTISFFNTHIHLRKHYILTQNEHTGDIHALIVAKDLTEEELAKKESAYKLKVQKQELAIALNNAEQRLKVIDGLCNEYHIVFYVDVRADLCIPYVLPENEHWRYKIGEFQETPFSKLIGRYITRNTSKEDREELFKKSAMNVVLSELENKDTYQINYKTKKGRKVEHSQVRIVRIDNNKYEQVWAFRSIEHIVREESKQQKILQELLIKAKKAEQAKTTFLLNMSHDIRTPMNAIIGFNTIAKDNIDNKEEALNALKKTDIASHHLLNLINEVLEMARIESNKMKIHTQFVSVKEYFEQIDQMFSISMKEKDIKFVTENYYTIPYIYIDVTRVMQVVTNLLGNAMKFTKAGGKIHYISRELDKTDDGYINYEIVVSDTGIGMSSEFQKKLFDAFEREENPTTSNIAGTGLGLAISKKIAVMLGGSLTCKSKQGKGSEFTFRFKAKIADEKQCEKELNNDESKETVNKIDCTNKRLLVVEDNELNLEIAIKIISRYGFKVESANNGSVAVEMIKKSNPGYYDLVLMDIQMPVMDGYTATTKIRHLKNKSLAEIPIVAMTANAFEEDKQKALEVGMNGHLSKPINISKLLEIIQKTIIF